MVRVTHKRRSLRKFAASGASVVEVELGAGPFGEEPKVGALPDVGCNVEWTEVQIEGLEGTQLPRLAAHDRRVRGLTAPGAT
jgi:hypothetical protein